MAVKAIFLDRDDTIIDDPGFISDPQQVKLLPGVTQSLIELQKLGYKLVIVTNQSGVARGIVTEKMLGRIHQRLESLLSRDGAYIDGIYYCPYHPDGVIPRYSKESDMRKPNPGMILQAAGDLKIDLGNSWAVGNSYRDVAAGLRAGCKTILINSPTKPAQKTSTDPSPDKIAVNIKEAVNIIKMYNRRAKPKKTVESVPPPEEAIPKEEPKAIIEPVKPDETEQIELETEQREQPQEAEDEMDVEKKPAGVEKTHQLLEEMLKHFRVSQRQDMFQEFSLMKLATRMAQILVFLCLLISVWFIVEPAKNPILAQSVIGLAIVFQLMVITFYMMDKRK